ncbi:MAG: LamG-like jellyroll fold domain-containing protein [Verrucomicrobiota bacterium]
MSWWRAEGDANDVSGHNGVLVSGATFGPGKIGQGFRFDGTNSYVQVADSAALKPSTITCEAWIWLDPALPSGRGGEQIVFKKNTWSAWFEGYSLAKTSVDNGNSTFSDRFEFCVSRTGNQVSIKSSTIAQRGVWYHVAGTYDGTQSKLYVNGVLEASASPGFALDYDTTPIFIGTSGTWAPYLSMFGGIIDELAIFNRALSTEEVQSIYNAGTDGKCVPASPPATNCVPMPAGVVATWRAEGNAVDSIAGYTGSLENVSFAAGESGQGFVFNPSSGSPRISIPDQPAFALTNSLSIEGWIYPTGPGWTVFWRGDYRGGLDPYFIQMNPDEGNILQFIIEQESPNTSVVIGSAPLAFNQWYHIAATLDGATGAMLLYTNGVLAAATNTTIRPFANLVAANEATIGIGNLGEHFFDHPFIGKIDEISLYSRALSVGEIQSIHTAGSYGKCAPGPLSNCTTAPAGLVGWWSGNDTAVDFVSGNSATLQNGAGYTAAAVGDGFNLDGTDDRVLVPNSSSLNFGPGQDFSVECWIKAFPNSNPSNVRSIVEKRNAAENYRGYALFLWDGRLACQLSEISSGDNYFSGSANLQDGTFHHVAMTVQRNSSSGGRLYVDGQVVLNFDPTGHAGDLANADYLRIGNHPAPGDGSFFQGVIDDVSVYNRALSQSEIQSVYSAAGGGKCAPSSSPSTNCSPSPSGLVAWWKAENNAVDSVGGHDGVLQNVSFNPGKVGQSFACNLNLPYGTYSGVQVPDHAAFALTNTFSIEGWVKPRGDGYVIFFRGDHRPGLDPYAVSMQANNTLRFQICDQNNNVAAADAAIPYQQWTHFAATLNGPAGVISLYTNGVLAAQVSTTIRPFADLIPGEAPGIGIGNVNDGGNNFPFMGDIDEIAFYNRALSAAEIQSIYTAGTFGKCGVGPGNAGCTPLPAGAVGWWRAEGSPLDEVSANSATLQNGAQITTGQVGQAFSFNGNGSYAKVPQTPALNVGGQVTVEFWMKADPANAMNTYQGLVTSDFYGIEIANGYVLGSLGVNFFISTDGGASASPSSYPDTATVNGGGAVVSAGAWHHVAGTYDGTKLQLYIDGQPWGSPNYHSGAISPMLANSFVSIGSEDGRTVCSPCIQNRYFNGLIDEPTIYNRALTASEIAAIYTAGSSGKCPPTGLVPGNVPVISALQPPVGPVGLPLNIVGTNFDTTPANNTVYFGAVHTPVLGASATNLQVVVPSGATFAPVTVTVNGLTAFSMRPFQPTFPGGNASLNTGSFAAGFNLAAGDGPGSMVIADLDGDGKPDLAEVNGNSHTVSVYRNLADAGPYGPSSFAARVDLPLSAGNNGGNPYRLRVADLDGDGRLDLMVCEVNGSRVSLFRNVAAPGGLTVNSFEAPVSLAVGADARFATAADLDADGRADLVVVNFGGNSLSVLKNLASPGSLTTNSFALPVNFATPAGPYEVAIADLDGDGQPDLTVANHDAQVVSIFRNVAVPGILNAASFAARVDLPSADRGHTLAIGDLDGDGRLDLVAGFVEPQLISVFRNVSSAGVLTAGSFAAPVNFSTPGWMHTAALADFNGDGRLDIAVVGELPSYLSVWENLSTPGSFTTSSLGARNDFGTGWNAWGVAAGDLDGDGRPDLVFCNAYDANLTVYQNISPTTAMNTNIFYVDLNSPSPAAPYHSWATAAHTIQEAVDAAHAGALILVNDGTYAVGTRVAGGVASRVVVNRAMTLQSVRGAGVTIIDGTAEGRCAYLADGVVLTGFTLTNGLSTADGGGAFCVSTNVWLRDCTLVGNSAAGHQGGGAFGGSLSNCVVRGNVAFSGAGADSSRLESCLVTGNDSSAVFFGSGGGVNKSFAQDCTISGNRCWNGGGARGSTLQNCTLDNNYAGGSGGGADNCTLSRCRVSNNTSAPGGGLNACTADNCLLTGNVANWGGGASGSTLNQCTLVGNWCVFDAGGAASCTLNNCIVYFNALPYSPGSLNVNFSPDCSINSSCTWPQPVSGGGNITNNPVFVSQLNGDYHLLSSSPCINMGGIAGSVGAKDLDGNVRVFDGVPDFGAYEFQSPVGPLVLAQADYLKTLVGVPLNFSGGAFRGQFTDICWDFGDGVIVSNQLAVSHAWSGGGNYLVTLTAAGPAGSASTNLTVHVTAPRIQPASQSVAVGNNALFSVASEDVAQLSWQWLANGTNLPAATKGSLTVFNVQPENAGLYTAAVTLNPPAGYPPGQRTVTTPSAILTVNPGICYPPPPALVSWWRGESNALDQVTGNDGVLMNGTTFAPGRVGTAFHFDGTSNYISIPSTSTLKIAGHFTVEAWIRYDRQTGSNGGTIVMKGPDDEVPADWALSVSSNHRLRPHVNLAGGWHYFDCGTELKPDVWYHVAMVYNGTFLAGYVNGQLDGTMVVIDQYPYPGVRTSDYPVKIGAYASGVSPDATSFFSGEIDDVAIYSRALGYFGDTDIPGVYAAGAGGKCDVPVAPTLMANPAGTNVLPGTSAMFSAVIAGSRPLSYQWLADNVPLAGETNAELVLADIQYSQSGKYYSVIATNAAGGVTSDGALLNVINTPPQIAGPANQTVSYVAAAVTLPFTVADAESAASNLVVTVSSSNTSLLPVSQIVLDGTDTSRLLALTPVLNQLGNSVVTLSVVDPGGFSNQLSFTFSVINNLPEISGIADVQMPPGTSTPPLAFTVSDAETPAELLTVTATSLTPSVIPSGNLVLGGLGTNRTIVVTSTVPGSASIAIEATDALGGLTRIILQVNVVNQAPQLSTLAAVRAPLNAVIGPLAFTVTDDQTPAEQIVVKATSSNNSIVPTNQIVLGGSGVNRTVTILPGTNVAGVATVSLTATDNLGGTSARTFSVSLDQFQGTNAGLPFLIYSAMAWGDYDNDGQLDLLVSGTTNNSASGGISRIYRNVGGVFTNSPFIALTNLLRSAVAWSDYDRDGYLDAVVSGINSSNIPATVLFHNNGNGTFTRTNVGFANAYNGTLAWGDFDNDGAADLFLSGLQIVSSNGVTAVTTNVAKLYRNNRDGTFTDMNSLFVTADNRIAGPNGGSASWGDYDNDGRPDLLLVGSINNGQSGIAHIYRNLGGGAFTNSYTSVYASGMYPGGSGAWADWDGDGWLDFAVTGSSALTAIYRNSRTGTFSVAQPLSSTTTPTLSWGDYNNDGYPDLLLVGSTTTLYRNNAGLTFSSAPTGAGLAGKANGTGAWGDVNNDGRLDLVLAGIDGATVYRNASALANSVPAIPANLAAALGSSNNVVLTWSLPADAQTRSNGLSFNLRVGTAPGGIDVVSPLADPVTGFRRVAALGNAGPTNRAVLLNLQKGTYYWSVQGIDTAFAGSPFAELASGAPYQFTITNARPVISDLADIVIGPGTNAPGPVIPFTIGDLETPAGNLVVTVRSSNTNVVALTNIVFGGSNSNRTLRVAARTNGVSVITVTVTDAQGAFASDSFTVRAEAFTLMAANFIPVENSCVAWGDYNNDGRLDVWISGMQVSAAGLVFTNQLYRNDGNGVFTPVPSGFPSVAYGSAAWGDYDNDGWLDLAVSGSTNVTVSGAVGRLYRNNGNGTFTSIQAALPAAWNSSLAWGDYNNDGRADLLISGASTGGVFTRIYRNDGDGTFINAVSFTGVQFGAVAWADFNGDGDLDVVYSGQTGGGAGWAEVQSNLGNGSFVLAATLTGVYNCALATGDFDNDGRPDIFLSGYNGSYLSRVYHNNGTLLFGNDPGSILGARYVSSAFGDFDNDGRLDILLSGTSNGGATGGFTRLYRSSSTGNSGAVYTNFPVAFQTNYSGIVSWVDYDNNGTLDVLLTGTDGAAVGQNYPRSQTFLYRNNANVLNTPPGAPTALVSLRTNNLVTLRWASSTDVQMSSNRDPLGQPIAGTNFFMLRHQVRVSTTPGGINIAAPNSDLATGFRRIVQAGDASTNRWLLRDLPPGTYYWSVQGIDGAFAGSPFAAETSFIIPHMPVAVADSFATPLNTPFNFPPAKLTLNDLSPDGYPLTVVTVSATGSAGGAAALSGGRIYYTPPSTSFSGNDSFTYTITDGLGSSVAGTFIVTVGNGGAVALNLVYGPANENGEFVVRFAGIPGFLYTVEWAPEPTGPWQKAVNLSAPNTDTGFGIGVFEFRESVGTDSARYYRTVYPPY